MMSWMLRPWLNWRKPFFQNAGHPHRTSTTSCSSGSHNASLFLELRTQVSHQLHALSVSPVVVPAVRQRREQLIETVNQHIAQLDGELLALVRIAQKSAAEELELQGKAAICALDFQFRVLDG